MKILHGYPPSKPLSRLRSLAECFGVPVEYVRITDFGSLVCSLKEIEQHGAVVLDVESLAKLCHKNELQQLASVLAGCTLSVMLLVTSGNEPECQFLQSATNGAVQRAKPLPQAKTISFPAQPRRIIGELASYSYSSDDRPGIGLATDVNCGPEVLMRVDQSPSFVHTRIGNAVVFVWSTLDIFDVERPLRAEIEFETAADQYVPLIIFLRFAFGNQCWHNPDPGGGIVIDDPLLKKNYGFIKFPKLLESARRDKYHVTLAFIPWNHWRSRAKNIRMFLDYSDCFGVCAHGCDHTNKEFGSADYDWLLSKTFIASKRMERHFSRTALPSAPLMVLPQEQYSMEAMRAFADSRQFMGLVCTACMPRNLAKPEMTAADLLLPAQDSFYGFPVFKRHYWKADMSTFAMSLFLGKPAILVEHHEFFRDGASGAEEFVRWLREVRPDVQWRPLIETVARTHARRRIAKGKWEVRFFTDLFYLEQKDEGTIEYRLIRRIPETVHVERVLVNGSEVSFSRENGYIIFDTYMSGPQAISVQIEVAPIKPTKSYSPGLQYQTSVALRRGLSEFRDNVVARNPIALRLATRVMKSIKQAAR